MAKDLAREELIRNRARHNNYALTEDVGYLFARIAELEAALAELVRHEPLYPHWVEEADMYFMSCVHCQGDMDEGNRVFMHEVTCPHPLAKKVLNGR